MRGNRIKHRMLWVENLLGNGLKRFCVDHDLEDRTPTPPSDLLFTEAAPFHGASPPVVLYAKKLSFGWTKFRGAGQVEGLQSAQNHVVLVSVPGQVIFDISTPTDTNY